MTMDRNLVLHQTKAAGTFTFKAAVLEELFQHITHERDAAVLAEREACAALAFAELGQLHAWQAARIVRDAILARSEPAPAQPPEPAPGFVRVRIACAVDAAGEWHAAGDGKWDDETAACMANQHDVRGRPRRLSWITAMAPRPVPAIDVAGATAPPPAGPDVLAALRRLADGKAPQAGDEALARAALEALRSLAGTGAAA